MAYKKISPSTCGFPFTIKKSEKTKRSGEALVFVEGKSKLWVFNNV